MERDDEGNDLSIAFESNAIRIIQQRYPDASEALCRRLGESVSIRRKRVLYSRRHQEKRAKRVLSPDQQVVAFDIPNISLFPLDQNAVIQETSATPEPLPEETPIAMSVRPSETAASIPDSDAQSAVACKTVL